MREIKFRCWDKEAKRMFYEKEWVATAIKHLILGSLRSSLIPMQYTGLKDKNGKEIYEGDVLESVESLLYEVIFHDGVYTGKLITPKNCMLRDKFPLLAHIISHCKIIGNKFQNPELLSDKE